MKKFIFGLTALLFSVSIMTGFAAGGSTGYEGSDKEADRKAAIAEKKAHKKEKKAEIKKKKAEEAKKKHLKKEKTENKSDGQ